MKLTEKYSVRLRKASERVEYYRTCLEKLSGVLHKKLQESTELHTLPSSDESDESDQTPAGSRVLRGLGSGGGRLQQRKASGRGRGRPATKKPEVPTKAADGRRRVGRPPRQLARFPPGMCITCCNMSLKEAGGPPHLRDRCEATKTRIAEDPGMLVPKRSRCEKEPNAETHRSASPSSMLWCDSSSSTSSSD